MTFTEPAPPPHPADVPAPRAPTMTDVAPRADVVTQSTTIEQTRAVAEVAALVDVAHRWPREKDRAIAELRDTCGLYFVAERAFYEFKRAGSRVHGPTIHLMVEVANCWRNIAYDVAELYRDAAAGRSEAQAWAWDLERNVRSSQRWIVPHQRDRKGGPVELSELRDIYEKTANEGSRRVREAIRRVVPAWFVDMAVTLCQETLERGSDAGKKAVPLDVRIADAIARFDELGVRRGQLEIKVDRPVGEWTARTLASLHVTYVSVNRGEISVGDAFPSEAVTAGEIVAQHDSLSAPADVDPEPMPTPPAEYDDAGNLLPPDRPFE